MSNFIVAELEQKEQFMMTEAVCVDHRPGKCVCHRHNHFREAYQFSRTQANVMSTRGQTEVTIHLCELS